MNGIGHTKLTKGLSLQLQQFLATVVNSAANATIFPTRMFKTSQLIQFRAHSIPRPSLLRQRQIAHDIGARVHELRFQIGDCRADLLIDLSADAGRAQEETIAEEAQRDIDVADAAEDAVPADRVEGFAGVAEDEEDEDYVANAAGVSVV